MYNDKIIFIILLKDSDLLRRETKYYGNERFIFNGFGVYKTIRLLFEGCSARVNCRMEFYFKC